MRLTDLLPHVTTVTTSKKHVGHHKSLVPVDVTTVSDMDDTKKAENVLSGENHHKEQGIAQVSSKNPECVRHFPLEEGQAKTRSARWHEICPGYWEECFSCPHHQWHIKRPGPFCQRHRFSAITEADLVGYVPEEVNQ
jgi:hypothetical protein